MVTDPRVSRLLEQRLGGIYRDPARVNRDASIVLKSSIGEHLIPNVTVYADDRTGDTNTVLVLQGTIAIHYRGQTYQLLMDIYIIGQYPMKPPICYVRLVPNMYIKEHHNHVASDTGKVTIPYLSEWNASTHNLIEMIVAISSIFSNDPPVFSRPPPPVVQQHHVPPPQQQQHVPAVMAYSSMSSSSHAMVPAVGNISGNSSSNWRTQREQLDHAIALETEDSNRAMALIRQSEHDEIERQKAIHVYEATQVQHLKNTVNAKIQTYCREQRTKVQQHVQEDYNDSQALRSTTEISKQIQDYQTLQNTLQHQISIVDEKTIEIQQWLKQQQQEQNASTTTTPKRSIDELVTTNTKVQQQMMEYEAESQAISDTLYYLDKALYEQTITMEVHLKHIRTLAKQQFYIKAHLYKLMK
jgi:ESCRT-I complex subunit TSG101